MSRIEFEKLKVAVLDFFTQRPHKSLNRSKIAKGLKLSKTEYKLLKSILRDLLRDGQVKRIDKQTYSLAGVEARQYKGKIQITKSGPGFIKSDEFKDELFVRKSDLGNALNGDIVIFEVVPGKRNRLEAVVEDVAERARTRFVGTLQKEKGFGFCIPDDRKVHMDFFISPKHMGKAENGQKILVELVDWKAGTRKPEAKIVEILGFPGDKGVDIQSVFKSYDIHEQFPDEINRMVDFLPDEIDPDELKKRRDFRDDEIFTIDPVDAKDFDDAVSLSTMENGNYKLGVHIADVSHFVKEDDLIDKEALKRGCSVYLVDRVISMLPERLANDLCSLKPNVDRYTYSILIEINPKSFDIVRYEVVKSLIHSKRRFTYEEVQKILDEKLPDPFYDTLNAMLKLSQALRKKRFDSGSIDFHTVEVRFQLDEQGKPTGIVRKKQLDSMKLIEEFMLLANICAAHQVDKLSKEQNKELPSVYRVHEKPSQQKMDFLKAFLHGMDINVKFPEKMSPKTFQSIMGPLLDGESGDIINDVAVRSMMKAMYSVKNIGHFGLGFSHYSHFTSPIRRYPDLILHRILYEFEHKAAKPRIAKLKKHLPMVCELSSENEINAERAERDSVRLKQIEFISEYIGEQFSGKISGVTEYGLYVEIEEYLIEGMVRLKSMSDDTYIFDAKTLRVKGKRHHKSYSLGQQVEIEVVDANKFTQTVDFKFV
ncbi:MAG: ribonuclease R [Calditrichaeota bacterium]|nr:ribonuclease R [Calditrichota bacterium]